MQYLELVRKTYVEAIALKSDIPTDLRSALRSHERMPLFFKNLAIELDNVQKLRVRKKKKPYEEKFIKDVIYDFIDIFIAGIKNEAQARYESDIAKAQAAQKAQEQKDLDATASGNVSGEYQEIFEDGGITATDDRSII